MAPKRYRLEERIDKARVAEPLLGQARTMPEVVAPRSAESTEADSLKPTTCHTA